MKIFNYIFLLIYHSLLYFCFVALNCDLTSAQHNVRHHANKTRSSSLDDRQLHFQFLKQPQSQLVNPNDSVVFDCPYQIKKEEKLDVRIEWRKDSLIVNSVRSTGRILVLGNNSISIEGAIVADEGSYQCVVHFTDSHSKLWSFISNKANLYISSTVLKFSAEPQAQAVLLGKSAAFECQVKHNEIFFKPMVTWYHNGQVLHFLNNDLKIVPLLNTLEIKSVKETHLGSYYCIISYNGFEKRSETGILSMKGPADVGILSSLAFTISPPLEISVNEKDDFVLPCLPKSLSETITKWVNGNKSNALSSLERVKKVGHASILIEGALPSDSGTYFCQLSNGEESTEKGVRVNVRSKPTLMKGLVDEIAQETKDIEMSCKSQFNSQVPKISWYKNSEPIIPSEYFVVDDGTLKVLGLVKEDQGVYQCLIENEVGSVQSHSQIMINTPASHLFLAGSSGQPKKPGQPMGLKSTNVGSRFIALSWDPPLGNSEDIVRYHIIYKELDQTRERVLNTSDTFITINALLPEVEYNCSVAAENYAGLGLSIAIQVKTSKEDSVPGKIRNLKALPIDSESVDVSWESPVKVADSVPILHYNLFYSRSKGNDKETRVPMIKTSHTLHGLAKNCEYKIRIEPLGKNGAGPSSEILLIKTLPDIPSGKPKNLKVLNEGQDTIKLSWKELSEDEINGDITGYTIKYKAKKKGSKTKNILSQGSSTQFELRNLDGGTQYTIRIGALNNMGAGPYSDPIQAETILEEKDELQIAGAPTELRLIPSYDKINVSWSSPPGDSVIKGFLLGWGIHVPDLHTATVDANTRNFLITGVRPKSEYVVSCRAFNKAGPGFPIYETIKTTSYTNNGFSGFGKSENKSPEDDESVEMYDESFSNNNKHFDTNRQENGVPNYVVAETLSATSIKVSWNEENINVFNPEYTIRYLSRADSNGDAKHINTNDNEVEIEGLRPNTVYEFTVRLVGASKWSNPASNRTNPAPPSSSPQDLTIIPHPQNYRGKDPNSITLNWIPPLFSNGEILEYLVYYTENSDWPDKDWLVDSVRGDRLSLTIEKLAPRQTYFFKVGSRNVRGYGPLSRPVSYTLGGLRLNNKKSDSDFINSELLPMLRANFVIIIIGVITIVVMILIIILCAVICSAKKNDPKNNTQLANGGIYSTVNHRRQNTMDRDNKNGVSDLWISNNASSSARDHYCETPDITLIDGQRMAKTSRDSPPPLYQHLQQGGTLQRSYHHSSNSLEMGNQRQRTPQIIYTGSNRIPIAKIDFTSTTTSDLDLGSNYSGSTTALPIQTPPPQGDIIGYRPQRGANHLRSFTHLNNAGTTMNNAHSRTAHIVRPLLTNGTNSPVAATTPTVPHNTSPGIMKAYSQANMTNNNSQQHVPIGRAAAQPRINMSSLYSVSPAKSQHYDLVMSNGDETDSRYSESLSGLQSNDGDTRIPNYHNSNSTEELNATMNNLDTMIGDLQALQHEINSDA